MLGKGEKIKKNSDLTDKYEKNILVKLLIYLGKIKTASEYEAYLKQINKSFFSWFFVIFVMRASLIFICLLAASSFYVTPILEKLITAEGISLTWFLIIDFKKDLFEVNKNG